MRATGYIPDPNDPRDLPASDLLAAGAVPPSADNTRLVVNVLDQGDYSSCVANAGFQAVRANHVRQGIQQPQLGSRLFGYYLARSSHGAQRRDAGTFIRAFFSVLNRFGFPPEDAWPYSKPVNSAPNFNALRAANDQRNPTTYHRIYEAGAARIDAIKRAVAHGYLVVFGTDISHELMSLRAGADPIMPPARNAVVGGHAMAVVGYEGDVFKIVNSWGSGFADGGFFRMSAEYLKWGYTQDLWIVEHAPRYSA